MNNLKKKFFYIKEIFEIPKIKKYDSISLLEKGCYPIITTTTLNNGVEKFVNVDPIYIIKGNSITISTNGISFVSFYHENDFAVNNDILVIKSNNLNKYNALYICTILKLECVKWSYGRKAKNNKVSETKILLPCLDNGDPNWDYMTNFIKKIFFKLKFPNLLKKIKNKQNKLSLNTKTWKWFKIENIFTKTNFKKHRAIDILNKGYIPLVSSTTKNNGIFKYVEASNLLEKNCISIASGGEAFTSFYHDKKITISHHVEIITSKHLNQYNALFICTILKLEKFKYNFTRSAKNNKIFETKIKLPSLNEEPDWNFMSDYVKNNKYTKILNLFK